MNFPGKKSTVSFQIFQLSIMMPKIRKNYCEISEENTKQRTKNIDRDRQTERQTDDGNFIRPSVGQFLGIICLVHKDCKRKNISCYYIWYF